MQIQALVLDTAPQSLDEDVVQSPSPAIHTDANTLDLESAGEGLTGKLTTLIGVENTGFALYQSLIEGLKTKPGIEGIGQLPTEHVAAVPIDDSHQVHESLSQRIVGNIGAPDLIGR